MMDDYEARIAECDVFAVEYREMEKECKRKLSQISLFFHKVNEMKLLYELGFRTIYDDQKNRKSEIENCTADVGVLVKQIKALDATEKELHDILKLKIAWLFQFIKDVKSKDHVLEDFFTDLNSGVDAELAVNNEEVYY